MKPFRHTKCKKTIVDMKIVRINSRTVVEVPQSMTDETARMRFETNQIKNMEGLHNPDKHNIDFFR